LRSAEALSKFPRRISNFVFLFIPIIYHTLEFLQDVFLGSRFSYEGLSFYYDLSRWVLDTYSKMQEILCKSLVIKHLYYMVSFMFIAKIGYDLLRSISFVAKIGHT
jgi:hypothetical protein